MGCALFMGFIAAEAAFIAASAGFMPLRGVYRVYGCAYTAGHFGFD
jgi:hypothetical protein